MRDYSTMQLMHIKHEKLHIAPVHLFDVSSWNQVPLWDGSHLSVLVFGDLEELIEASSSIFKWHSLNIKRKPVAKKPIVIGVVKWFVWWHPYNSF